jgi:hypothetical protein
MVVRPKSLGYKMVARPTTFESGKELSGDLKTNPFGYV